MSIFDSITKKSKLKAAIKQTTEARKSEGVQADQLFNKVYHAYAEVVTGEPLIAEALYHWGFALLHQARTKPAEQAAKLYQDAIAKFSFCLTIEPAYLGAAIDGGVAYMELARIKSVSPGDGLYGRAKNYFEKANAIQAGSASYNLACIYGLRSDKEACLNALEIAKNKGSLPAIEDIMSDPDMQGVKDHVWFSDFIESLANEPEEAEKVEEVADSSAEPQQETSLEIEEQAVVEPQTDTVAEPEVQETEAVDDIVSEPLVQEVLTEASEETFISQSSEEVEVIQTATESETPASFQQMPKDETA